MVELKGSEFMENTPASLRGAGCDLRRDQKKKPIVTGNLSRQWECMKEVGSVQDVEAGEEGRNQDK